MADTQRQKGQERRRAEWRNRKTFTELSVSKLELPPVGYRQYWDGAKSGLSVLVSAHGTRTYRSTFCLTKGGKDGKDVYVSRKLGRVDRMGLAAAREFMREDRDIAAKGIDPRELTSDEDRKNALKGVNPLLVKKAAEAKKAADKPFEVVVDQFIEHYAKPRQKTWDQTERALKVNCATWLNRRMSEITKQDARDLLRGFIAEGHPYKAVVTERWLKVLWKWATREDLVDVNMMDAVKVEIEKSERDRVYDDTEIKAIWNAADKLDPIEGAYIKLVMLLAPRKTALACMTRGELDNADDPTLWTTPFELTKSKKNPKKKRVYKTPLPPLAQRIIKGLPKSDNPTDRLFPSLPIFVSKAGQRSFSSLGLTQKLTKSGGPKDFAYHVARHTIATWLENEGHSEWERGLVLNHAGSGVTDDYSHGFAHKLKLELLTKWADHVERLVQPEGVTLLR
ncbi:protein of unknown function [Rhizobiales bacterium GAS191]|nr:protein of unknown function [Rhizobiales bacterium GAS191]